MKSSKPILIALFIMISVLSSPIYAQDPDTNPDAADLRPNCSVPVYATGDGTIDRMVLLDNVTLPNILGRVNLLKIRTFSNINGKFIEYPAMCLPSALSSKQLYEDEPLKEGSLLGYENTQKVDLGKVTLPTASAP